MSDATAAEPGARDSEVRRDRRWLLGRWPSLVGALVAAVAVYDSDEVDLAPLVLFLAVNYLVAEISRRRWAAWLGTLGIMVVYPLSQRLDPELLRTLVLAAAIAGVLVGAVIALVRSGGEIVTQSAAMLSFGAVAAVALYVDPTVGAYLVAAGLIGHGIWDIIHHRRNLVVSRAFAEFCAVLDVLAGAAVIWLTTSAG